ncbi:MAG: retropepsin-like aspartic protease [Candidatus Daviesbacteria bacterium]|nr:retropepsin-like aspartic protease [Candidatus Daviesbacteria bacterium]
MKFPYRKINLQNPFNSKDFILRPIIPFSIKYNDRSLRFEALIDSGADFNIFPFEIAKKLRINLKKSDELTFVGVGGNFIDGIKADVILEMGSEKIKTKVVFAPIDNGILGQYGFFDLCKINFNLKKKIIEIEFN